MKIILYTTIIAFIYYMALLFAANRFIAKKFGRTPTIEGHILPRSSLMLIAVNINVICCLLLSHDPLMNYMTYMLGDLPSIFTYLSSGAIFFLVNLIAISLSYIISKILAEFIDKNNASHVRPFVWITINLILIKLTILYYEAYIGTQNFTIL